MNDLCLSVRPFLRLSVCVFICMNKFIVFCSLLFLHSFFTLSFLFSFSFLFLYSLSFLMNIFLTHTRTRTHKYIWIYVPSYDSYILLQKDVSEVSYSSDSIISYLIKLDKIIIIILLLWYYLHAMTIHWIIIVIDIVIVIVIICNGSMYVSSRLVLSWLVLPCLGVSGLVLLLLL